MNALSPDPLDEALAEYKSALNASQAAEMLDVHPATVYRLIKAGRLRTISLGAGEQRRTIVRISRKSVAEFLSNATEVA